MAQLAELVPTLVDGKEIIAMVTDRKLEFKKQVYNFPAMCS